jgi:hypothetical protein
MCHVTGKLSSELLLVKSVDYFLFTAFYLKKKFTPGVSSWIHRAIKKALQAMNFTVCIRIYTVLRTTGDDQARARR